jgi:hypothetical protein
MRIVHSFIRCLLRTFAITIIGLQTTVSEAQVESPANLAGSPPVFQPIPGPSTDGLLSSLLFDYGHSSNDWCITLQFTPTSNFSFHKWLIPADPFDSQVQLCFTNGVQIPSKDFTNSSTLNLPVFTTVSNALRTVRPNRRYGHWPHGVAGQTFQTTSFCLRDIFGIEFTNDVILQISPLMYMEDTNSETVHLKQFPPVTVELMANGSVKKIDEK